MNFGIGEVVVIATLVIAMALVVRLTGGARQSRASKRKRETGDSRPDWLGGLENSEKPKRDKHYTLGDDGELVEIPTEDRDAAPKTRKRG
ncbi:MAG: hypothetical protein K8I60_20735 [Anaerolineae bacterium]|nr:hypothetical protein [Anaerolineae bacterium]